MVKACRPPQNGWDDPAFEGDLEALGWRGEVEECPPVDGDGPVTKLSVEMKVFEPEELAQVIRPGGALIGLRRGEGSPVCLRLEAQRLVHLADRFPVRSPVLPFRRLYDRVIEVIDIDPVGDETRPPVGGGHLHPVRRFQRAHVIPPSPIQNRMPEERPAVRSQPDNGARPAP